MLGPTLKYVKRTDIMLSSLTRRATNKQMNKQPQRLKRKKVCPPYPPDPIIRCYIYCLYYLSKKKKCLKNFFKDIWWTSFWKILKTLQLLFECALLSIALFPPDSLFRWIVCIVIISLKLINKIEKNQEAKKTPEAPGPVETGFSVSAQMVSVCSWGFCP